MAIFKKNTWGLSKVITDLNNYADWIYTIKREKRNPKSKFNKWELKHNYFYTLYFTLAVNEEEEKLPENIKRLRLLESLAPLNRYLDDELGFAECLVPEVNEIIDDSGKSTLYHLISYRFAFTKLSLRWVVRWLIILGILIYILARINIIHTIIGWIALI